MQLHTPSHPQPSGWAVVFMVSLSGASPAAPAANLMYFACVPGTEQILSGLNGKYRHLMVMATLCLSKCEWKDILENCVLFLPPSSRDKQGTCLRGHQPGTFHE